MGRMFVFFVFFFVCPALIRAQPDSTSPVRYVAVGDSYTMGEGADLKGSWPVILTLHLQRQGVPIQLKKILARTGWATSEAIVYALPGFQELKPNFATLMIGVNDWVRGVSPEEFRKRLAILIDQMLKSLPDKKNLVVVTIPNFSVTPSAKQYARGRDIAAGLSAFNAIIKSEAALRHLEVVDIFPVSQEMQNDSTLVAEDGLHPSAREYALWEQWIFPAAYGILK